MQPSKNHLSSATVETSRTTALNVVVADDRADLTDSIGDYFEDLGHAVRIAHTGAEAIELLERERADAFIVDLRLPDVDGFLVVQLARKRYGPQLRIVAMTGFAGPIQRERAKAVGVDAFVEKPVRLEQLAALIAPEETPGQ
ncbi:MAG: response regulator [Myxococcaceae bacterium]|nr:response regulator [Myxococcaceae bacterium]